MKKQILIFSIALVAGSLYTKAQTGNVGISTTKPRTNLDVNGTMNVKNDIKLGGTDAAAGGSGTLGDLISANGNNNPQWKNFDLPQGYGNSMILSAMYLNSSETGVALVGETTTGSPYSVPYNEDQNMTTPTQWQEITGVAQTFTITKITSSTAISVQTVAQSNTANGTSFGCGIFIDDKLKFVRTGTISGAAGSYRTLNLNTSLPNLSVGNHTLKFACVKRNISNPIYIVSVGQPSQGQTNLNNKMAATSATIKVFEPMN